MKAWHFIREDRRLGYDDGREVKVGETLSCTGEPKLCENGMHGSKRILDALIYAPGQICCRVEITGDVSVSDDKVVGRHRKVLAMVDASNIFHEFACRCSEDALALIGKPDPRSVAAIKAKRDWICGKITDAELAAARDAARDAAWAASWAASWAAAGDASWAAASDAQNRRLTSMVSAAIRKQT